MSTLKNFKLGVCGTMDSYCINRPFRNFEKESEESAVHSDSFGNSRKSGESHPYSSPAPPCKFELFFIYLHLSIVIRFFFKPVNFFSELFSHLLILSLTGECIMSYFIAGIGPRL